MELERSANAQEATQIALNKQVQLQALAASINVESCLIQGPGTGTIARETAKSRVLKLQEHVNRLLEESNISDIEEN